VQLLADITGKKLVLLQSDDASAIGAIYLAMEALGMDIQEIVNNEATERVVIYQMQKHMPFTARYSRYTRNFITI
jgi:sugar (pentulose or hexulose) kinase